MISYFIVSILLVSFTTFLLFYVRKGLKPAYVKSYWMLIGLLVLVSVFLGTVMGEVNGQRVLLNSKKSFYRAEIQAVSGYDHRGIRTVLKDTVWSLHLTRAPINIPINNPFWYMNGKDTLWSTATFKYEIKNH